MKILLIQPPIQDFYRTSIRSQPIGLTYLAASLQKSGHEVEILDCHLGKRRSIQIPSELSYLKDFYPFNDRSPFKLYTGYYHFGLDWEEIKQRIKESKAEAFGISSSFTPYHGEAVEIARIIKQWSKERIVIMGGGHVSCDPEGVLKSPYVDYIILQEGEIRLPLLLEQIERRDRKRIDEVDGVGYRVNGELIIKHPEGFIKNLDLLPYPARELLDLDQYRIGRRRSTMIITSRGCPQGCAYCSTHLIMGTSFRSRSPENIIKEMIECRDKYGIEIFDIEDDNFTFDKERVKRLMRLIIQTFKEQTIELRAMNGISFTSLDGELLAMMKRAGFSTINLSFVSLDPYIKKSIGRPLAQHDFDEILEMTRQIGLNVIAYAIFGMPGQSIDEMIDTLIYLMGKTVLLGPSIYYPTPKTSLFKRCKEEGILPPLPSQWRSSAFPIETKGFNRLDLVTLLRLVRAINFIKGKIDRKELEEGVMLKDLDKIFKDKFGVEGSLSWIDLMFLLLREKSFFSLKKDSGGYIRIFKEKTSQKVLDYFIERAWKAPIMGSRNV